MQTHKWLSNSLKVLENIPPQYRATEVNLDGDGVSPEKTLGILWLATDDVAIYFQIILYFGKIPTNKENFFKTDCNTV